MKMFEYAIQEGEWGKINPQDLIQLAHANGIKTTTDDNRKTVIKIIPIPEQKQDVCWVHHKQDPKLRNRPISLTVNPNSQTLLTNLFEIIKGVERYILSKNYLRLIPPGGNYPESWNGRETLEKQRLLIAETFDPIADQLKPTFPKRKRDKTKRRIPLHRDNCMSSSLMEGSLT